MFPSPVVLWAQTFEKNRVIRNTRPGLRSSSVFDAVLTLQQMNFCTRCGNSQQPYKRSIWAKSVWDETQTRITTASCSRYDLGSLFVRAPDISQSRSPMSAIDGQNACETKHRPFLNHIQPLYVCDVVFITVYRLSLFAVTSIVGGREALASTYFPPHQPTWCRVILDNNFLPLSSMKSKMYLSELPPRSTKNARNTFQLRSESLFWKESSVMFGIWANIPRN